MTPLLFRLKMDSTGALPNFLLSACIGIFATVLFRLPPVVQCPTCAPALSCSGTADSSRTEQPYSPVGWYLFLGESLLPALVLTTSYWRRRVGVSQQVFVDAALSGVETEAAAQVQFLRNARRLKAMR